MAKGPEAKVKDAIKRLLKKRGIWYYMPVQYGMGVVGIPDFICCWEGTFLAIEAKAPGKRKNTSANQKQRISDIRNAGGIAIVVDDVKQVEEMINALEEIEEPAGKAGLQEGVRSGPEEAVGVSFRAE